MSDRTPASAEMVSSMEASFMAGGGEMGTLMRSIDWARTPLGPVSGWSQALRTMAGLLLRNRFPLLLWWGPDFVQLYNDAYKPIPGHKHPRSLGQPARECWAEIWDIIGPMIEAPFRGEPATWSDDLSLLHNRRGFLEETHYKVAYSPVPDESVVPTGIGGVLATVAETTEQVIGQRQLRTLRDLGVRAAEAKTVKEACEGAAEVLTENAKDVPFALFYLLEEGGKSAHLISKAGEFGRGSQAAPDVIDLKGGASDGAWPLSDLIAKRVPHVFRHLGKRLGALPRGPWSESPDSAIALPLASPDQAHCDGVLIAGISPHRLLDDSYRSFFDLAAAQLVTAIRNVRAHQESRRRAEALAEIDRAKTAFFSNVSHEFRTPLTLMLGPLEEAVSAPPATPLDLHHEGLETAHRNAQRLLKLTNTLLDFARIEAGRTQACYEPTDLAALTTELAGVFRSAVERAGLRLRVECPPLPETIYVDRDMWEKIVLNLLSNAFKFTMDGEIAVALRPVSGAVELEVKDTGTGIAASELPNLFKRFHRIRGAKGRSHEGSGIGLALLHELVRLHGGSVTVESTPGSGTTFRIRIPTGKGHLPQDRIGGESRSSPVSSMASPFVEEVQRWLPTPAAELESALPSGDRPPSKSLRILLADDNADMRAYLTRMLSRFWTIQTATDGTSALKQAQADLPDLILTDVMMPGMDGFGLVHALKKDARTKGIPVIMLSARAGEEATVEGLQSGASDYLIKPFSASELFARVQGQLEASRLRLKTEQEHRQLYELFLQAPSPIGVFRGPDGIIEVANPSYLRLMGKTNEQELLGKPLLEALPQLRGEEVDLLLREVLKEGRPVLGKETLVTLDRGDGSEDTYWSSVYAPLRASHGAADRVVCLASEVTAQVRSRRAAEAANRELESRVQERTQQLQEAVRELESFTYTIAHDLRAPLRTVCRFSDVLIEDYANRPLDPQGEDFLRRIGSAAWRMDRLIDDLLAFSRLTRAEIRRSPLELTTVLDEVLAELGPVVQAAGARIEILGPLPRVLGDRTLLSQVWSNLIQNAIKFVAPGVLPKVRIAAQKRARRVRVEIQDNGIGIDPAFQGRLFNVFERIGGPQDYPGTGIGLAIVKRALDKMGGSVGIESQAGSGSTFWFILDAPPA